MFALHGSLHTVDSLLRSSHCSHRRGRSNGESWQDMPLKYILVIFVYDLSLTLAYKSVFDTFTLKLVITPNFV